MFTIMDHGVPLCSYPADVQHLVGAKSPLHSDLEGFIPFSISMDMRDAFRTFSTENPSPHPPSTANGPATSVEGMCSCKFPDIPLLIGDPT